jgi:hypothetical protein
MYVPKRHQRTRPFSTAVRNEFKVRLADLESYLLEKLAGAEGDILEARAWCFAMRWWSPYIHGEYDAVIIKVLSGEYHHLFKSSMMYRENFILPSGYLT